MYQFEYVRASSVQEASQKAQQGGQYLAGGQTLLASMKQRLAQPETLLDLGSLAELQGIREEGSALVIGAMTRHQDVETDALVKARIPALAALAAGIGDKQVRAMGTLGGSLANNDPAACYPCAVLGLGATVNTDQRIIPADEYFQGMYTTALEPGELIVSVGFPVPQQAAYAKFRQPASRFALVGVFVAKTAGGVRVAITGAGNGVFRHEGLENALNADFSPDVVANVQIDADDLSADLHASAAYRAQLIKVQAQRAVAMALGQEV
ncbi:FAD binding domain-containing protein [Orrella marina]|uniref:Carbon monoxide dehydrogenase n=1 Tax=Orrella marina TaxID=2163011 RepID=A0A2R4XKY1_9BURK|nr:xanthine dehydrogenase family protein subunit M [Orrella marina]AWB34434.1 carbon monoxide dehydrogenase [Orrella marina]